MAVQQLTQPILNPIAAFDATKEQTISFVVIGGAQVVANRLVIQDNQTGVEIYSNIESTLKLEHTIPANTLKNGGYYNAVVYTLDNSNTLSSPSTPVPFYCYTQPLLTITNIPATETIENGTYTFEGSYSQIEGELLNSYQFTLYDSNKEVLSQTPLIYYETDSSLSYTFVGMNNDTSYYIELSGQTLNNTSMSTGLLYFTVRYIQPASFAICDLVNDCKDGYVQISSNIVAIDGHSNPDPPIYIDDKKVDLRDPDSYVEWNSGFRIQDDFTMRAWGRDFNDYQNIITLTNDINTEETPNKIELKWMLGDVVKEQLSYEDINGELINVSDSVTAPIKNLEIYGNSIQVDRNADVYVEGKSTQEVQAASFKTATGNPVTITDGELDKPVKLGQIDGLSTQATRSGKNKFDLAKVNTSNMVVLNNTGFNLVNAWATPIINNTNLIQMLKPSTTYTCYSKCKVKNRPSYTSTSNHNSVLILYKDGVGQRQLSIIDKTLDIEQISVRTFTTPDDLDGWSMLGYAFHGNNDGSTIYKGIGEIEVKDLMIVEGTYTAENFPDFELYGVSPSPDYPSEIHSIGDDVNLFSGFYRTNDDNQYGEYSNGVYTSNTRLGVATWVYKKELKNGEILTISYQNRVSAEFKYVLSNNDISTSDAIVDLTLTSGTNISNDEIINNSSNYKYLYISFRMIRGVTLGSISNIKLQKGTVATPYSEYGKGTVTIEQRGKNLFYLKNMPDNSWISMNETQTIKIKQGTGIAPEPIPLDINLNIGDVVTISVICLKGKYIHNTNNPSLISIGLYHNGDIKSWQGEIQLPVEKSLTNKIYTVTTTITEEVNSFMSFVYGSPTIEEDIEFYVQVELGTEATDYEPYFSKDYVIPLSAPLRSLPNGTKDTIEEGTHRRVGQKILSANDISDLLTSYSIPCARIKKRETLGMPTINILNAVMMTSYSDAGKVNFQNTANGQFNAYQDRYYLNIFDERFTDLETAKSLLEGEEIIYELAEEVVEPFTDEQKEVLNSITTQSGTNIFDAQTNMELKYNYNYEIPSPEVESPIKSVGDDVNLFDKDNATITSLNCDGGTSFYNAQTTKSIIFDCSKYEQLAISKKIGNYFAIIASSKYPVAGVAGVIGTRLAIDNTKSKDFFSINCKDYNYLTIVFWINTDTITESQMLDTIKIQKGTVATPYSEYGEGTVTIEHSGKNLFSNKFEDYYKPVDYYVCPIKLEKGKNYYASAILKGTKMTGSVIGIVPYGIKYSDFSTKLTVILNTAGITVDKLITVTDEFTDPKLVIYTSDKTTFNELFNNYYVQLEEGVEATDYQPYFNKTYTLPLSEPLRSLPNGTKDILNNKGITRRVGKIVLNGSENWEGFISSYKNTIRAQVLISDMHNIGNNVGLNIMSSHFLPKDLYGHDIVGIEHTYNQLFIRINKYDLDEISLNGFKAWLAAHPTEVIYELATTQNESYEGQTPSPDTPSPIISVGDVKNLIDVPDFNVDYNQQYYQDTNTNFLLKPNYTYTLSFDFNINKSSTDLYYSLGYGTDRYATDITKTTIYSTQTKGRNDITFTVPADIPDNSYLWVRFARTIILADINVDISNIQLEKGKEDTGYQPTTDYNIYPTVSSKNLFDYDNPLYIRTNNLNYNEISNGYHMSPISVGENTEFTIGIENCFNEGDIYALSFSQLGEFGYVAMYKTLKGTQERVNIIDLNNNIFTAPSQNYDLELVFSMSSSALSNSLEIWSIQIEANNTQTTYETHEENSSIITLDTPLNRIGDYADWVGNISPNLLNPVTGSAIVEENTDYFYNKKSTYTASVTIQYKNADGNVISSETLTNDSTISTPENCIEIHIEGLNEQAIKTNHLQIRKGNSNKPYLPYITEPSLIKVTGKIVLDGSSDENWGLSGKTFYTDCVSDYKRGNFIPISNYFKGINTKSFAGEMLIDNTIAFGIPAETINRIYIKCDNITTIDGFKTWLSTHNTEVIYVLEEPKITPLSSLNSEALKTLETYEPISNVYTNNKLLGTLDLDYANGKDMKEVQNAYVLLKCWNGNKMPYVIHSNYIDIPESTENIFIWMRRKKNIFDLRIENLTKGD